MTTYYGIEDGEEFRPWLWEAPNNNIGKTELVRRDGFPKASGKAIYGRDFKIQGMLVPRLWNLPMHMPESFPWIRQELRRCPVSER